MSNHRTCFFFGSMLTTIVIFAIVSPAFVSRVNAARDEVAAKQRAGQIRAPHSRPHTQSDTFTVTPTATPQPSETAIETAITTATPLVATETPTEIGTPTTEPTLEPTATVSADITSTPEPTTEIQTPTPTHLPTQTATPTAPVLATETPFVGETLAPTPQPTNLLIAVRGRVILQGRDNAEGVVIRDEMGAEILVLTKKRSFTLSHAPGNLNLIVERTGYLSEQIQVTLSENAFEQELPPVTLYAGDVNQDGVIDETDAEHIAKDFGAVNDATAASDVNGDGDINVLDLVLAGMNFGKRAFDAP